MTPCADQAVEFGRRPAFRRVGRCPVGGECRRHGRAHAIDSIPDSNRAADSPPSIPHQDLRRLDPRDRLEAARLDGLAQLRDGPEVARRSAAGR